MLSVWSIFQKILQHDGSTTAVGANSLSYTDGGYQQQSLYPEYAGGNGFAGAGAVSITLYYY